MNRFQYLILWITLASPFFILHAVSFAQTDTLTDEEYRQEIQTYLTTPCFEEMGNIMKKTMKNLKPVPLTGVKLLRYIDPEGLEKLENKMTDSFLKNIKGESNKDKRILLYKLGSLYCIDGMKENMSNDVSSATQSMQTVKPKNKLAPSISKKPSNSSESVSDQAKQKALKICKESMQILGGEMSYRFLNACIEQEMQAYQEFQRNYGD